VYNGMNSTIGYYRGKHDATNSIAAGALSGALFKSTRGTRPMAISAGICASVAGGWAVSLPSNNVKHSNANITQLTRKVFFDPDLS
jgi:import inner membrane translocase subunit TIM23